LLRLLTSESGPEQNCGPPAPTSAIEGKADLLCSIRGLPLLTQCMVRPCVARGFRRSVGFAVLHQCIRPLIGACAPDHHGYQRACELISGQASVGHLGHQGSHAPGRPILHLVSSSRRPRQAVNVVRTLPAPFLCSSFVRAVTVPSSRPALVAERRAQRPSGLAVAWRSYWLRCFQATP
jgi:hypothetical protein